MGGRVMEEWWVCWGWWEVFVNVVFVRECRLIVVFFCLVVGGGGCFVVFGVVDSGDVGVLIVWESIMCLVGVLVRSGGWGLNSDVFFFFIVLFFIFIDVCLYKNIFFFFDVWLWFWCCMLLFIIDFCLVFLGLLFIFFFLCFVLLLGSFFLLFFIFCLYIGFFVDDFFYLCVF